MLPDVRDRSQPLLPAKAAPGKASGTACVLLSSPDALRTRGWRILLALLTVNAFVMALLLVLTKSYPSLMSSGLLAFSFGLRHSVDADHIAAIDNVTRRLVASGKQPQLIGLFFSLGHSSVVMIICIATVCGAEYLQNSGLFEGVGALVSTAVSASVLLLIGVANLLSLASGHDEGEGHEHSDSSFVERCCPQLLRSINSPAQMVGLGFLFGLGFETSSEVALLALAAMSPSNGIPAPCTLLLPLLFAGGMSLIDTLDGLVMSWAYSYAARTGGRATFNVVLTAASSVIAIAIGLVEILGIVQRQYDLEGPVWSQVETINDNFEYVGYAIIAFFLVSLLAGAILWTCPLRGCHEVTSSSSCAV